MASKHHVGVKCPDDLWRLFRSRCVAEGAELGDVLAQLVADHMGVKLAPSTSTVPGQLELAKPPAKRSSSTTSPAKRRRAGKAAQTAAKTRRAAEAKSRASDREKRSRGA